MAQQNSNIPELDKQAPKSGCVFLQVILDYLTANSRDLAQILDAPHQNGGRPGYPAQGMLRLHILQFLTNKRYSNKFLDSIDDNPRLLAMCGLDRVPSESTYCRFKKDLTEHEVQVDRIHAAVLKGCYNEIERLREEGIIPADAPYLGEILAFDATDIETYASHKKKKLDGIETSDNEDPPELSDKDARKGYRTPKNKSETKGEKEFYIGYKPQVGNDAYYGLPIYINTQPANKNEGPWLRADLDAVLKQHPWLKPRYLVADKGYHALYNFQHAVQLGITPIIAIPKPPKDPKTGKRLYGGIYTADGRPTCLGGHPMDYRGTDADGEHYFRCPAKGCRLKDKVDWSRYCDFEHSEKPAGKMLRIMGTVPRFTEQWNNLFRFRPSIERYFSSAKHSRLLDQHQYLSMAKVSTHAKMSTLSYLLTALAHLKADDYESMRHMSIRLPQTPAQTVD